MGRLSCRTVIKMVDGKKRRKRVCRRLHPHNYKPFKSYSKSPRKSSRKSSRKSTIRRYVRTSK